MERLEERRLLAADVDPGGTVRLEVGKLDIEGTKKADVIVVDFNATTGQIDVTLNGEAKGSFLPSQITAGIEVESREGNDSVTFGPGITVGVDVDGDKGNDTITGGSGADILKGGPGKDVINGGGGFDEIEGEDGKDSLSGGPGTDDIDGGNGKDTLNGEDDSDTLRGGTGNDILNGGTGDDRIRGENGKDTCDGGDGNDDIDGGLGRDKDHGGAGSDDFNQSDNSNRRGKLLDRIDDLEAGEDDADDNITAEQVPAAVTAAFNTKYPGATIREIELEQEDIGPVYRFDFLAGTNPLRAWFKEDGSFVSEEVK
jgi:Ca2+-binding RTX toxin-like protein